MGCVSMCGLVFTVSAVLANKRTHYRLNRKAQRSGLNVCFLFGLLHSEAAMVEIHVKLLSDKKVCRSQQHGAKRYQTKLYEYWQQ